MATEKPTPTVAPYYFVKLNIPWRYADGVRALVPEGKPVAGALLDVILKAARDQGLVSDQSDTDPDEIARLRHQVTALQGEVASLGQRLDSALAVMGRR